MTEVTTPYNITAACDGQESKKSEWNEYNDVSEGENKRFRHERMNHQKQSGNDDIITEIKELPVTMERKVAKDLLDSLGNAGLPRATIAASKKFPNGTPGRPQDKTVLEQHIQFWDTDHDNVIYPLDTWRGFRKLGFNIGFSAFAVGVIHGGFSYPTQKSWIPILGNPTFKIRVDRIHKSKHGSDSETYDTEGRFVPQKFEEIFSKYDRENKGGLNLSDIMRLIRGNANAMDPFGWTSAVFEWGTLYLLCAQNGVIHKDDARTCFDGSLFFRMAESEEKCKKGAGLSSILHELKEE